MNDGEFVAYVDQLQNEIWRNKIRRGFNTVIVGKELVLMMEEMGEVARAFRDENPEQVLAEIGDLLIYSLGLCKLLGGNAGELILRTQRANETRTHRSKL